MNIRVLFTAGLLAAAAAAAGLFVAAGAVAAAPRESKSGEKPSFPLPPGWTEADLQACMVAGTPGKMHEHLAKGVGVWDGKCTMWMFPGAEPIQCESKLTVTSIMDGRYIQSEITGEMPGMGPYRGLGFSGFDNVSQKFVATWIDNHSTGMLNGTGELSADSKTITWNYTINCPITKKPAAIRDVETITGPNTKTLVSYATDPKSGKEFKMMSIELTRRPAEAGGQ